MLPLPPPAGYWNRLHSATNKFIWNNKSPRIKLVTLQRARNSGGQNLPNFKYYFWSFTLRALSTWLNPAESRVKPHRLEDAVYSNIPNKNCLVKFGAIVSNLISVWHSIGKVLTVCKYHLNVPLFNNHSITLDGKPISLHNWSGKGIHVLADIIQDNRLRAFQDLKDSYNLPCTTFFFYLQLRSALNAYGVPWGTNPHTLPIHRLYTYGWFF